MTRVHNFCAGPCTLPQSVLEELAAELVDFEGQGMSLIEMSHRSPVYDRVHHETLDRLRSLVRLPDDFSVVLTGGGATLQFAMVPHNLLTGTDRAGYVVSGSWAKKAVADAQRVADAYVAWSGADDGFTRMPAADEIEISDGTRFLHITSNETIGGIRMPEFFDPGVPMVADMSSDYLSRPIPWDLFDVVYGGAQKNLGPAGLAVTFIRNSVLEQAPTDLPDYLRFGYHADADSLANTPPMFSIWATGKVLAWMEANGGVEAMEKRAAERSAMIYDVIDGSGGFYRSPVVVGDRSHMNVVFRVGAGSDSEELEPLFLAEAEELGLVNLKGHRSVGGIRASIYNALPTESVETLAGFMARFADGRV